MKIVIIAIVYLFIFIISFLNREAMVAWLQYSDVSQLPAMFFTSSLLAIIPIIPFTLFAGLMGIKFGLLIGVLINWTGCLVSAIFYYLVTKYIKTDFFVNLISHNKHVSKFEMMMNKNIFISILIARLIPIPALVINIYSALSGVPFYLYVIASAFGFIPSMVILTYGGEQIINNMYTFIIAVFLYLLFLLIVIGFYRFYFYRRKIRI